MTLCFLIRHAHHDGDPDRLTGRTNPKLSPKGLSEAEKLARAFKAAHLTHIVSSPERRALETAAAIARATSCKIEVSYALDEIDYGSWTGRTFADLERDASYREWIIARATAHPPGGETMQDVQDRIVHALTCFAKRQPSGRAAMITHAEPIRAAELFCRGLGLNRWQDVDIPFASVTTIAIGHHGQMVISKAAA